MSATSPELFGYDINKAFKAFQRVPVNMQHEIFRASFAAAGVQWPPDQHQAPEAASVFAPKRK